MSCEDKKGEENHPPQSNISGDEIKLEKSEEPKMDDKIDKQKGEESLEPMIISLNSMNQKIEMSKGQNENNNETKERKIFKAK